jgi:hypothetical protein
MWLAYIGADAVAIYGLSTLFNRYKLPTGGGGSGHATSSSPLEILWAVSINHALFVHVWSLR